MDQNDIEKEIRLKNIKPLDIFDGFSPTDMYAILYDPYSKDCPIQINREISEGLLTQSPFFNIVQSILNKIIESNGLKLTATGNLPPGVVKAIYAEGYLLDYVFEKGISTLRTEKDWVALHCVNIVLQLAGVVRKYNKKIVVTKKGKSLFQDSKGELFFAILEVFTTKFNWGYNDLYPKDVAQTGFLFLIHLLKKHGHSFRGTNFYADYYIKAFPAFKEVTGRYGTAEDEIRRIIEIRFFERFAGWFGLVENEKGKSFIRLSGNVKVKKTKLFGELFG